MSTTHMRMLYTQNKLLLDTLVKFYENKEFLDKMVSIINGVSKLSLRIIDWFVTNYSKKYFVIYNIPPDTRFKVYNEYKLKLKAYGKVNFDPFCRWSRITIPFNDDYYMETTIGQLNFFKWAIENNILNYIEEHYTEIENDMTVRNSTSKNKKPATAESEGVNFGMGAGGGGGGGKTRKKREELSVSACKCIKTENVPIVIHF